MQWCFWFPNYFKIHLLKWKKINFLISKCDIESLLNNYILVIELAPNNFWLYMNEIKSILCGCEFDIICGKVPPQISGCWILVCSLIRQLHWTLLLFLLRSINVLKVNRFQHRPRCLTLLIKASWNYIGKSVTVVLCLKKQGLYTDTIATVRVNILVCYLRKCLLNTCVS